MRVRDPCDQGLPRMQRMLKGEMTRRLARCYPSGSNVDKAPGSNEVSTLVFYLQSRPLKIQKCSALLMARAEHDARSDPANLHCTVMIMQEIVEKIRQHFGLFSESALAIVDIVLDRAQDPVFLEASTNLFIAFNTDQKGLVFNNRPDFAKRFLNVMQKLANIATTTSPDSRTMALRALESLARSEALSTTIGQKALPIAIRGIQVNVPQKRIYYEGDKRGEDRVGMEALVCLRKFLDSTYMDQTSTVLTNLLDWVAHTPSAEDGWQSLFVAQIAKWVPPQSRFNVTQITVDAMYDLPKDSIKIATTYSGYLDVLLTADDSKIGLSVLDVLRKLIGIQHRLIVAPPHDAARVQHLISRLRGNISKLVELSTYLGQTNDMTAEILRPYSNTPLRPHMSRRSSVADSAESIASMDSLSAKPLGVIINDLFDLRDVLASNSPGEQHRLSPDIWNGTQWLLTSTQPQLLRLYVQCFQQVLQVAAKPDMLSAGTFVHQLVRQLGAQLAPANYVAIFYVLTRYLEKLGSESRYSLPWLYPLLVDTSGSEATQICRSSVVLGAFLCVFDLWDRTEEKQATLKLIQSREDAHLWLSEITYPLTVSSDDAIAATKSSADGFAPIEGDLKVSLDDLALNDEDKHAIMTPPRPEADSMGMNQDLKYTKLRDTTASIRSPSRNVTQPASLRSVPHVQELRRRETESSTHPSDEGKISLPTKRASTLSMDKPSDVLAVIDSVSCRGKPRGSLTA